MNNKNGFFCVCLSIFFVSTGVGASTIQAAQQKTSWQVVDKSIEELMNSGWQIVNHSVSRIVLFPGTVNARQEITFTYVLSKGNKFIQCMIDDPQPNNASSYCRRMN